MPRRLSDEINELKVQDNISDSTLVLYYRTPTTQERVGYTNESIQRKRNKIVYRQGEARLKYGGLILTGIGEGDFERKEGDGFVPISSDSSSKHYYKDWKEHIKKYASDLIDLLAIHVFDMAAELEDIEDQEEKDKEEPPAEIGEDIEQD